MAQKFCSYCCCSFCCTLLSSSPPQSSQQQQQQPRPISISSPPPQQSIAAHSQETTPNMTDFKNFLDNFSDITQIDTLISFLEDLVKIASGENSDSLCSRSNSAVASYINDGHTILKMLDTRFGKRSVKQNSADSTFQEIEKVCIEVLRGSEKIPQVGIALCMVGSVLERFTQMSENKSECLNVLERMLNLGKQIVHLNEQIPDHKEKLNKGVQCIIEGTIMCTSQLARANIFRFITAQVSEKSLKDFQNKIDQFCIDIGIWTGIDTGKRLTDIRERVNDIGDRVPKIASESQKIYAYRPTVGIESAQENVIELLELNAQDPTVIVVVVYGFGGIGKTTLADAVYAHLNLQSYKHCRISMDQDCTNNDLKGYQEQILNGLFRENIKLRNCDEGQGRLSSFFEKNSNQPLFLYIDNGLKSTDLEKLLPKVLNSCLPRRSRILVTTRNLQETDKFVGRNIVRREHKVSSLPESEARNLLLENVSDCNDEDNIVNILKLCGGVPLLLELAGSQLATNRGNTKSIVLEMLKGGENVKERDISDRMVGFVYNRLLPPVQGAFLDIASFFYKDWRSREVASIVGEEEFRALEAASFVKTNEYGRVIVHDIVLARGKKLSSEEGNRITDSTESLLECLKNDKKLKKLRGIRLTRDSEQPPTEINCHHLNCMSNSLRALRYTGSRITFTEKCQKPFEQLRCLVIEGDVPDLPMEFERLEHLAYYYGPMTQGMNLYEFPPSLRHMFIQDYSEKGVAYSDIPPKVTPDSSLVELEINCFSKMQMLPDGLEKLTKLERLTLWRCDELRELPSKLGDLSNLKELTLYDCNELKELPSNFGQLTNLEELNLSFCFELAELPSDLGQLQNLRKLKLKYCSKLKEWPLSFAALTKMEEIDLSCSFELAELPSDLGQLQNLRKLKLSNCSKLEEWPLSFAALTKMEVIDLGGCSSKLKDSLPQNIKGNNCIILE